MMLLLSHRPTSLTQELLPPEHPDLQDRVLALPLLLALHPPRFQTLLLVERQFPAILPGFPAVSANRRIYRQLGQSSCFTQVTGIRFGIRSKRKSPVFFRLTRKPLVLFRHRL